MAKIIDFVTRRYSCDEYLDACAETEATCMHGHYGCAAWPCGPCSDEILEAVQDAMRDDYVADLRLAELEQERS